MNRSMQTRRDLLEARRTWLASTRVGLSRDASRVPWAIVGLVLAIPAALLGGRTLGAIVAAGAVLVPFVAFYIVWAHRNENAAEYDAVSRQIDALDQATEAPPTRTPWRIEGKRTQL